MAGFSDRVNDLIYGSLFGNEFAKRLGKVNLISESRKLSEKPFDPTNAMPYGYQSPVTVGGVGHALSNAVPGVSDVLSGVYALNDLSNKDYKSAALNSLGILPFIGGTFIGKESKTFPQSAMRLAEEMEGKGIDSRSIYNDTGLYRAPWDNQWRSEIDDSASKGISAKALAAKKKEHMVWDDDAQMKLPVMYRTKAPDALKHKQLYEAYPELKNIGANVLRSYYGSDASFDGGNIRFDPALSADDVGDISLHELQHAIQKIEGWTPGGHLDPNFKGPWDQFDPNYRNMAGEVEARLVQKRRNYSLERRKNTFPLDDIDVAIGNILTRDRGWK